jgi:RNA polymerase sigma factor (sigma-70 family)
MDSQPDDALLMNELAMGRDAALGELMKRWEGPLRCFIERMCGSPNSIGEVWQDIWTRVYLYRKKYDTRRPFRPFLFTVALNACRSAQGRWKNYWSGNVGGEALDQWPADCPDPADSLSSDEQKRQLHEAIERLPEMQRAVVLLYLLCDSDYGRIAQILGRSPGTIRSQMHHALRNLRSRLERLGATGAQHPCARTNAQGTAASQPWHPRLAADSNEVTRD